MCYTRSLSSLAAAPETVALTTNANLNVAELVLALVPLEGIETAHAIETDIVAPDATVVTDIETETEKIEIAKETETETVTEDLVAGVIAVTDIAIAGTAAATANHAIIETATGIDEIIAAMMIEIVETVEMIVADVHLGEVRLQKRRILLVDEVRMFLPIHSVFISRWCCETFY